MNEGLILNVSAPWRETQKLKASAAWIDTETATRLDGEARDLTYTHFRSHGNIKYSDFARVIFVELSMGGS